MPSKPTNAVKVCGACAETKRITEFSRKGAGGRSARCRPCMNLASHNAYPGKSEAYKAKRRRDGFRNGLLYNYGMTLAAYADLLAKQGGVCAVCGASASDGGRRLAVDHDHATGRVRGLLCRACNRSIGGLKDSTVLLQSALTYLTEHVTSPF